MVEQWIENPCVESSILSPGTTSDELASHRNIKLRMKKKINKKLLILTIALIAGLTFLSSTVAFKMPNVPEFYYYYWIILNPIIFIVGSFVDSVGELNEGIGIVLLITLQYIILVPAIVYFCKKLIERAKELGIIVVLLLLLLPIVSILALAGNTAMDLLFDLDYQGK